MFKSALVHLRGTQSDDATLVAALRQVQPFSGHLQCLHVRPDLGYLLRYAPTLDAEDDSTAVVRALEILEKEASAAARRAADGFAAFCKKEGILTGGTSAAQGKLTAAFNQETGGEIDRLISHARSHDLVVVKGGGEEAGGLPADEVGRLIVSAGRPVVLAPSVLARNVRIVAIAWKDTPEAARALSVALPIIAKAEKVFVFNVAEEGQAKSECLDVVNHLRRHGVKADVHHVEPRGRDAADSLLETTRAAEADLLIMGAYGRNRLSEIVFGGFTQHVLQDASLPVFLFH